MQAHGKVFGQKELRHRIEVRHGRYVGFYQRRYEEVKKAIEEAAKKGIVITELVSGCANGVDKLGEKFALENGISIERYPADWDKFGKSAGYKRNAEMASVAEALVLIWDGMSNGSRSMLRMANERGLAVHVHLVQKPLT